MRPQYGANRSVASVPRPLRGSFSRMIRAGSLVLVAEARPATLTSMEWTAEHEMFRKTVRGVVEREIEPYVDEWEAAGIFPAHELFPKLGEAGLLGVEYDPAYGGQ